MARKSEPGAYFTGRTRALGELVAWLGTNRGGLCVVTGDPGSGKSAVLGRLVALVDPKRWRELGITHPPAATVPPEGSIDLTVWARGLTMGELIEEIAATIETSATTPDQLIDAVRERGRRLVVVIDALDEASGEGEARRVAQRLLKPLAATGRSIDVKVLVGTRRGPGNELLDALGAPTWSSTCAAGCSGRARPMRARRIGGSRRSPRTSLKQSPPAPTRAFSLHS